MSKETQMGSHTKRVGWQVWLSMFVIAVMSFIGIFAPILSPYDPRVINIGLSSNPPAWYHNTVIESSPDHLLGTDALGRDILSHIIHGARAAMFLVLIAIPTTVFLGVIMGLAAGTGNKAIETIFLRITEIISSIPTFMFSVIIVLIFRGRPLGHILGGLITLTLAFSLINWVSLARLVHIAVLKVRTMEFMEASRSLGASMGYQIFKHILPHISHLIVVWVVNNIPAVILLEALFGYIGIQILRVTNGTSFQDLSWGGLIYVGRTQLNWNPYMLLVPTISVLVISMSFSILGEYLNERLNPQLESSQIV